MPFIHLYISDLRPFFICCSYILVALFPIRVHDSAARPAYAASGQIGMLNFPELCLRIPGIIYFRQDPFPVVLIILFHHIPVHHILEHRNRRQEKHSDKHRHGHKPHLLPSPPHAPYNKMKKSTHLPLPPLLQSRYPSLHCCVQFMAGGLLNTRRRIRWKSSAHFLFHLHSIS